MENKNVTCTMGHGVIFVREDGDKVICKTLKYKLTSGKRITIAPMAIIDNDKLDRDDRKELLDTIIEDWGRMILSLENI